MSTPKGDVESRLLLSYNQKFRCEVCGGRFTRCNFYAHRMTRTHKAAMESKGISDTSINAFTTPITEKEEEVRIPKKQRMNQMYPERITCALCNGKYMWFTKTQHENTKKHRKAIVVVVDDSS
jgi:hypothetical protein